MSRSFLATLLALIPALSPAAGDRIVLKNKDQFTGEVLALKDGLIEIKTPHSDVPLKVLNQDLTRLSFATDEPNPDKEETRNDPQFLTLRNGDRFPGKVVSLDENHLGFETWFAGPLQIPREMIDSVVFGVTPQHTVYQGPRNIDGWEQEANNPWGFNHNTLFSRKKGFIGKNIPLPQNFIFKTTIGWKNSPNMRIHLCNEKASPIGNQVTEGYLIAVTSAGIQVSRTYSKDRSGAKYQGLIQHNNRLSKRTTKEIDLELRVNRQSRTLQLYLDGKKLEQGTDPGEAPKGTSFIFESSSTNNSNTIVSNIVVQEWDTVTEPTVTEPRADQETDTLSAKDGDRFSGKIIGFDNDTPDRPFLVKSPLSPDPIAIPSAHCAALYFSKGKESDPFEEGQYELALRPGGSLTLSGIQLGEDKLTATHPWLGEIKVDRRVMSSIRKGK